MSARKPVFRGLVLLPLLLSVVGCKTWEPATVTPQTLITDERPSSVRVTTADGIQVTLRSPLFVNDSIVSAVAPQPGAVVVPPRVGVPEADVNLMEVPRLSTGRTIALVGAIVAASVSWARIQGAGGGSEERPGPLPKDPALSLTGLVSLLVGWF